MQFTFSYEVKEPEDKLWGNLLPSGEWSGMIGQIIRKVSLFCRSMESTLNINYTLILILQEVDFGSGIFTITKERLDVVNFMSPFWEESLSFAIKLQGENTYMTYLRPFSVSIILIWF